MLGRTAQRLPTMLQFGVAVADTSTIVPE
jgi:hypothetical protein